VIRDADTGDLGLFEPGDFADLVDPTGAFVATALVDPRRSLCARVVSDRPDSHLDEAAFERRAASALRRRTELLEDPDTTAIRLVHGEADGLPGLRVDLWGDQLVATRSTDATARFDRVVYRVLAERLGDLPLWEQDHFEDLRRRAEGPGGARLPGRWIHGPATEPPETCLVREDGLTFEVEPRAGLTTGLYPDQRDNRRQLRALLAEGPEGARVANLFAHTGAFTVACASAGATEVLSIDLSPKYLERARRNLVLNGLDPEHHPTVAADAVAWLQRAPELHGVILDPPAHARGRGKGVDWSARRDYRALVEAAAQRLVPGGWLLCIVNLKGLPRDWLRRQLEAGLRGAGRGLDRTGPAPPAADHPRRRGFPEGTPFHGIVAWTR
jgi:23S rRNA (cytosine1962-C5)-methyltransferase